jgi:hypothetical protein
LLLNGLEGYAQRAGSSPHIYQQNAGSHIRQKLSITYQQFCGKQNQLQRQLFSAGFRGYQHSEADQESEST